MTDIDVYLPSADMPAALRKLEAAGYPRKYTNYGAAFLPWSSRDIGGAKRRSC